MRIGSLEAQLQGASNDVFALLLGLDMKKLLHFEAFWA